MMKGCDVRTPRKCLVCPDSFASFSACTVGYTGKKEGEEKEGEGEDTRYSERVSRVPLIGDCG